MKKIDLATLTTTCEASEKFGPGDRFLLGTGGVEFATPPPLDPFRFRRLFAGRWASLIELSEFNLMYKTLKLKATTHNTRRSAWCVEGMICIF